MSIVSAYVDLPKWDTLPGPDSAFIAEGDIFTRTEDGLDVSWLEGDPPNGAQVYVEWTPRVYAVWEEEDESGEGREDSDGSNPVERDEEVSAEPDLGSGEGGEGYGDVPAAGTGGEDEAAE